MSFQFGHFCFESSYKVENNLITRFAEPHSQFGSDISRNSKGYLHLPMSIDKNGFSWYYSSGVGFDVTYPKTQVFKKNDTIDFQKVLDDYSLDFRDSCHTESIRTSKSQLRNFIRDNNGEIWFRTMDDKCHKYSPVSKKIYSTQNHVLFEFQSTSAKFSKLFKFQPNQFFPQISINFYEISIKCTYSR